MLTLENLQFGYGKTNILWNLSVSLNQGSFVGIIGENGSGKSTLLKAIYGLLDLKGGQIKWKNKDLKGPSWNLVPGHREIKLVSQQADVSKNMNVVENLETCFYLKSENFIKKRIDELLEIVELQPYRLHKPNELSGGQKQRLALARALAEPPEILLLDEPFSQIDKYSTHRLLSELDKLRRQDNILIIFVSHDPEYVLNFTEQVLVIESGKIVQNDSPEEIYLHPSNIRTAGLTGVYSIIDENIIRPEFLKFSDSGIEAVVIRIIRSFRGYFYECLGEDTATYFVFESRIEKPGNTVFIAQKKV